MHWEAEEEWAWRETSMASNERERRSCNSLFAYTKHWKRYVCLFSFLPLHPSSPPSVSNNFYSLPRSSMYPLRYIKYHQNVQTSSLSLSFPHQQRYHSLYIAKVTVMITIMLTCITCFHWEDMIMVCVYKYKLTRTQGVHCLKGLWTCFEIVLINLFDRVAQGERVAVDVPDRCLPPPTCPVLSLYSH